MDGITEYFERALAEIDVLPPFPSVFQKILELTSDDSGSREDLIRCISLDSAIAAKVLQTINSAYYGVKQPVGNLQVAVGLLGNKRIREIALMCSVSGLLRHPIQGYGIPADRFWLHSVSTAMAARLIAERKVPEALGESFVAGLLHDIGKLVIDRLIEEPHREEIRAVVEETPYKLFETEIRNFGFDHCTAGFFLLRKWSFPESLQSAVAFHHHPATESDHPGLVHAVHAADMLSHMFSMGIADPDFILSLESPAEPPPFRLSPTDIQTALNQMKAEFFDAKSFLGM